jgi:anti-sigma factor RsiW
MRCADVRVLLGELAELAAGTPQAGPLGEHLATCAACGAELARWRALDDEVRRALGSAPAVPAGLEPRLREAMAEASGTRPRAARRAARPSRRQLLGLGVAASVAAALALSLRPDGRDLADRLPVIEAPIEDMATFLDSGREVDIVSSSPEAVRAWMAQRVGFDPPPPALAGLRLVGGRLCYLLDRRLVAYSYERHGRPLTLYLVPAGGLALPESGAAGEARGLRAIAWRDGELFRVLVVPLPTDQLRALASAG